MVFDFDGTILDTEDPGWRSWAEIWAEHGHDLPASQWGPLLGTHHTFDAFAALEALVGETLPPELRHRQERRNLELVHAAEIRPGVLAWLDEAEALGVPVGLASSSPIDWVEGNLARVGLLERFRCLTCADHVVPAKPDPTSFRLACERLGADPARSVAIEDSPNGIRAAKDAGLFTVAVPHGLTADLDLSAADVVLTSLEALALADALLAAGNR